MAENKLIKMEWKDEGNQQCLYDDSEKLICRIKKITGQINWALYAPDIFDELYMFPAHTKEVARWRATVMVYNECNRIANYFHKIRDHLPSLHELAAEAGI